MHKFHIFLVRTKNEQNIGNVARLMANFAVENLHLVAERRLIHCNLASVARKGYHLIEQAQHHQDLSTALSEMNLVLGFTCARERSIEKLTALNNFDLSSYPEDLKIGLVFGPEEDGLTRDELLQCQHLINIPTAANQSSLNLAQSVGIVLYEFCARQMKSREIEEKQEHIKFAELEVLDQKLQSIVNKSGFTLNGTKEDSYKLISHCLRRAEPTSREYRLWIALLDRVDKMLEEK